MDLVSEHLPRLARFERGRWLYGRDVTSPRGVLLRWFPSANYTSDELDSPHFVGLRKAAADAVSADASPAFVACAGLLAQQQAATREVRLLTADESDSCPATSSSAPEVRLLPAEESDSCPAAPSSAPPARSHLAFASFPAESCLHVSTGAASSLPSAILPDAQLELLGWKKRLRHVEFVYVESPYECDDADKRKMEGGSGAPILQFFPEKEYGTYREWWNATAAGEYRRLDESLHRVAAFANANGYSSLEDRSCWSPTFG